MSVSRTYDRSAEQPRFKTIRVHKSGTALGLYIPAEFVARLNMRPGMEVKAYVVRGVLCLQPVALDSFTPRVVGVAPVAPEEPVLADD